MEWSAVFKNRSRIIDWRTWNTWMEAIVRIREIESDFFLVPNPGELVYIGESEKLRLMHWMQKVHSVIKWRGEILRKDS